MTQASQSAANAGPLRQPVEVLLMALLTAVSIAVFSASDAAAHGFIGRLLLPIRMLVLALIATWLLRRDGLGWRDVGLAKPPRLWRTALLALGGYVVAYLLVGAMVAALFPALHLPSPTSSPIAGVHGHLGEYLYWLLPVTWGSAAFGEEMLFRGFFFSRLLQLTPKTGLGVGAALVLQTLLFGGVHLYLGLSGALVAGLLGLILGSVYLLGGRNLWACIVLHGLLDTTTITLNFLGLIKT